MLNVQTEAPPFSLMDQSGKLRSLEDFKGKYVVVYFYPYEGTPGCVKQACAIRDTYPEFEKLGVVVIGISVGSPENHADFAEQYHLPFTLLSDLHQKAAKAYGANGWFFPKRISYLISPNGIVIKCYPAVDPASHATVLLSDIQVELSRA